MDYREKITSVIDSMDLGEPIFNVKVGNKRVSLGEPAWTTDLNPDNLIERFVDGHASRVYSRTDRKYTVNIEDVIKGSEHSVFRDIIDIFIQCSPNAQPRRTLAFKNFYQILDQNRNVDSFKEAMFDIYEYYFNNTRTESITSTNNDIHRTNIYQLLCLMEKSYGKKTSKQ